MKIGFDYISVFSAGGNGTYSRELLKALAKVDDSNEYYLYNYLHKKILGRDEIVNKSNFIYRGGYLPYIGRTDRWQKFLRRKFFLFKARADKLDIFHLTNSARYFRGLDKFVLTIHDLSFLIAPEFSGHSINYLKKNYYQKLIKSASAIIAVSQNTKADILKNLDYPEEKITVIYEAAASDFYPDLQQEYLEEKFGLKGNYILAVGQIQPRKNINLLLKAFSQLPDELRDQNSLVLVGRPRNQKELEKLKQKIKDLKVTQETKFLGYVDLNELRYLYSSAAVFVYPSLYEGFGLPVLEAMACGAPVITTNISSLPEVAGQAAILVDPNNDEELREALIKVIADNNLREDLINKGLKQAKQFSWVKAAEETIKVYQQFSS